MVFFGVGVFVLSSAGQSLFSFPSFSAAGRSLSVFLFFTLRPPGPPGTMSARELRALDPTLILSDTLRPAPPRRARLPVSYLFRQQFHGVFAYIIIDISCTQRVLTVYKRRMGYAAFSLHTLYLLLCVIEKLVREAGKITDKR